MLAIAIDLASNIPIYQQIVDELRGLIARGGLAAGDALPSVRQLGAQVGVNLNTVARAYRILADEGLVELRHGAMARVRRAEPEHRPVIEEAEVRQLQNVIAKMVLRGVDRELIEQTLERVLDTVFSARSP